MEILVVLAIFATIAAMTVPNLVSRLAAADFRARVGDVVSLVRTAPLRTRLSGQDATFSPEQARRLGLTLMRLPSVDKVRYEFRGELTISSLGLCSAGEIRFAG